MLFIRAQYMVFAKEVHREWMTHATRERIFDLDLWDLYMMGA